MLAAEPGTSGHLITFYSYKGGTGRTMALANVACLLAEGGEVLVVDWDLEAPGLHRFFPPRLRAAGAGTDLGLDDGPGLIDLFGQLRDVLPATPPASEEDADAAVAAAFEKVPLDRYIRDTNVPNVRILRAGRNDDGQYSRRVGTFDWEDLFTRAPGIYRAFGEQLAARYRYVLIDSRTGVTDISGICTYLLPEQLVVVFTPNRQSLTGVRELVERATTYRRGSDDLRPLLVFPLPSRIEASLQDLRARWRFGDSDRDVIGYQPMFQDLLASSYGLSECDLSSYFDDVQIQQTPDYAYGEEIAVRRTGDRFSMANSYTVFVQRLTSGEPPWTARATQPADAPATSLADPVPPAMPAATARDPFHEGLEHDLPVGPPLRPRLTKAKPASAPAAAGGPQIYLSHVSRDRDRVKAIAEQLEQRGLRVWRADQVAPGARWDEAISKALDASEAVVVFWSRESIESSTVRVEAEEGLRRGVLVPVLLDDVSPPLAFRAVQSADLRRATEAAIARLCDAVEHVASGMPGTITQPPIGTPPQAAAPGTPATGRALRIAFATVVVVATVGLGSAVWFLGGKSAQPGQTTVTPPPEQTIKVPDFVGVSSADVSKTASILGLTLVMADETGKQSAYLEGVVIKQSPAANTSVAKSAKIELQIATKTVAVPTLVGTTLNSALPTLDKSGLRLGKTSSQPVADAKPGTIIRQAPEAGGRVAAGTSVDVVVATAPRPRQTAPAPSSPVQQTYPSPPAATLSEVPDLRGIALSDVRKAFAGTRLVLGKVSERQGLNAKAGIIVDQRPTAGSRVPLGSSVDVVVSAAPAAK